jgi:hypothetical protein
MHLKSVNKLKKSDFYVILDLIASLMKKISFLTLLLPFFLSSGCWYNGKSIENSHTDFMDQEFKDYIIFPQGSYWVYQDSATLNTDSVVLYSQIIEIVDRKIPAGYYVETVDQKFSSSFRNDTFRIFGEAVKDEQYSSCLLFAEGHSYNSFFSNKDIGDSINYILNNLKYSDFEAVKNINGVNFNEVKTFENIHPGNISLSHPEKIYYAKKIGVVRKELFNGKVWNLIRYHTSE